MVAVAHRDLDRVKELIVAGADVNAIVENRSALACALDLHSSEDPRERLRAALASGNIRYLLPNSTRWKIVTALREHGAIATDGASRHGGNGESPWPPTGGVALTRLDVWPTKAGFQEPIVVEVEVTNTGPVDARLAPDPRFEPPDALLGWAEFSLCRHPPLLPTACYDLGKSVPRVILWSPTERLAPKQALSAKVTIPTMDLYPGGYTVHTTLWLPGPFGEHQGGSLRSDFAMEGTAGEPVPFCSYADEELYRRLVFAAASIQRGQLASLFVVCEGEAAQAELVRLRSIFDHRFGFPDDSAPIHSLLKRLRAPSGELDGEDVRALEAVSTRILDLEGRLGSGARSATATVSAARDPIREVVREIDRYKKGGPKRTLARYRPIVSYERNESSFTDALDALTHPSDGRQEAIAYDAEDLAVLDNMLERATMAQGAQQSGKIARLAEQVKALRHR
jgi:hypothetical protein